MKRKGRKKEEEKLGTTEDMQILLKTKQNNMKSRRYREKTREDKERDQI